MKLSRDISGDELAKALRKLGYVATRQPTNNQTTKNTKTKTNKNQQQNQHIKKPQKKDQHKKTGSHLRLTTSEHGEHHVTIPRHDPIKIGTLAGIMQDVATHFDVTREQLLTRLFK